MNDDSLHIISMEEVYKTLEFYGVLHKFECIKCRSNFGTTTLALQHLRGRCTPNENYIPKVELLKKDQIKEEKKPRKPYTKKQKLTNQQYLKDINKRNSPKHRDNRNKYSEKDKRYILGSGQGRKYLAKRFNTNVDNISKLRTRWRRELTPSEFKDIRDERVTQGFKYQKNPSKDYKVEPADEK